MGQLAGLAPAPAWCALRAALCARGLACMRTGRPPQAAHSWLACCQALRHRLPGPMPAGLP